MFKWGYKTGSNLVKDENGDLLADSHNILNRWKNYCCQLLNIRNVTNVKQIEMRGSIHNFRDWSCRLVKNKLWA
jgi:hypothetical protein